VQVTLPSGNTVDLRDKLTAKDKFAVQAVIRLSLDTATGLQESSGSLVNDMRNALLGRLITAWSFSWPIPDNNAGNPLEELDLDDYDALSEAVEPMLEKVVGTNPNRRGRSSS
jgi:hypothetical protein